MNWQNRQVAVTGADGFIGSHLVELLVESGAKVKALAQYNSHGFWGWLENLDQEILKNVEVHFGDIRDAKFVDKLIQGSDVVFHLAALIGIPYSYIAPSSYVDTNIYGTQHVLEACLKHNIQRLLVTSTSEVYGTALETPITENHPKQPQSPYSASKISADALSLSYHLSFELPLSIVRPFNTYGPRQSARAFIPSVITQLLAGQNELNLGSLEPTRDLVYVKDTAQGFLKIAECSSLIGEEINIATNNEISMGKLANSIIDLINPNVTITVDKQRVRPQKSEVMQLLGSHQKLFNHTQWKPTISLDKGLQETVNWFKNKSDTHFYKSGIYNV